MKHNIIFIVIALLMPMAVLANEFDPPKDINDNNTLFLPLRVIMEIEGIPGEFNPNTPALDDITDNSILLKDYSLNDSRTVSEDYEDSLRAVGNLLEPQLNFTFLIDKATTVLYDSLLNGNVIPEIHIRTFYYNPNSSQYEELRTIDLKNCVIESISVSGSKDLDGLYHIGVIKFEAIRKTFNKILDNGNLDTGTGIATEWNYLTNSPSY